MWRMRVLLPSQVQYSRVHVDWCMVNSVLYLIFCQAKRDPLVLCLVYFNDVFSSPSDVQDARKIQKVNLLEIDPTLMIYVQ